MQATLQQVGGLAVQKLFAGPGMQARNSSGGQRGSGGATAAGVRATSGRSVAGLVGGSVETERGLRSGQVGPDCDFNFLEKLFDLDLGKLDTMLFAVIEEGREWKGKCEGVYMHPSVTAAFLTC
jgi:hypothetical protein